MFNNFPYIKYFASNFSFSQLQIIKKTLLYKIMIFLMPWVFFLSFKICFFFTWKFMPEISHLRSDRKHRLSAYRINDRTGSRIITFPSYPDCVGQHYSGKYIFFEGGGDKLILLEFYSYCSSYWYRKVFFRSGVVDSMIIVASHLLLL